MWIVFDAVGTLIQPTPAVPEVYQSAAEKMNVSISATTIIERIKIALPRHFPAGMVTSEMQQHSAWQNVVFEVLAEIPLGKRHDAFEYLWYHFSLPTSWALYEDVPAGLMTLAQERQAGREISVAIASNFDARLLTVVAGMPQLAVASQIFTSAEIGFNKPDRRFFDAVAERLRVRADSLTMIGDDFANDFQGAAEAGWSSIHLRRGEAINASHHSSRPGLSQASDFTAAVDLAMRGLAKNGLVGLS